MKTISCAALAVAVGGLAGVTASAESLNRPLDERPVGVRAEATPFPASLTKSPTQRFQYGNGLTSMPIDQVRKIMKTGEYQAARTAVGDEYWIDTGPIGFFDDGAGGVAGGIFLSGLWNDFILDDPAAAASPYEFGDGSSPIDFDPDGVSSIGVDWEVIEIETLDPVTGNTNIQLTIQPNVPINAFPFPGQFNVASAGTEIKWGGWGTFLSTNLFSDLNLPVEEGPDGTPDTADDLTLAEIEPLRLAHGLGSGNADTVPSTRQFANGSVSGPRLTFGEGGDSETNDIFIEPTTLGVNQLGGSTIFNNAGVLFGELFELDFDTLVDANGKPSNNVIDESIHVGGLVFFTVFQPTLAQAQDPAEPGIARQGYSGITHLYTVDDDVNAAPTATGLCCVNGVSSQTTRAACSGTFFGFGTTTDDVSCIDCPQITDLAGAIKEPGGNADSPDGTADNFNGGCTADDVQFTPYDFSFGGGDEGTTRDFLGSQVQGSLFTFQNTDGSLVQDTDSYAFVSEQAGFATITVSSEEPVLVNVIQGAGDVMPSGMPPGFTGFDPITGLDTNVADGCAGAVIIAQETTLDGCSVTIEVPVFADRFYYIDVTSPDAALSYNQPLDLGQADPGNPAPGIVVDDNGDALEGSIVYQLDTSFSSASAPTAGGACWTVDSCATVASAGDCTDGVFEADTLCEDSGFCPDPFDAAGTDEGEAEICDVATDFEPTTVEDTFNGGNFICNGVNDLGVDATAIADGETVNGETSAWRVAEVLAADDRQLQQEILQRDIDVYETVHDGGDFVFTVDAQFSASIQVVQLSCPEDPANPGQPQLTLDFVAEAADNPFNLGGGFDDCSGTELTLEALDAGTYWIRVSNDFAEETVCEDGNLGEPLRYALTIGDGGTTTPCPGDTDGDNLIGLNDLLTVLGNFGDNVAGGAADGDVDPIGGGDGVVGLGDLLLVLGEFGNTCP